MAYKRFEEYNKYINCERHTVVGDNKIMNPIISGLKFKNPNPVKNNGMRDLPLLKTKNIEYPKK